jgi:signal peptidase I
MCSSASSHWRDYLEALLVAVIFATFARTYVVQAFKIPSGSMEENLLIGDHILVNKMIYGAQASALERILFPHRDVRRGDVVVFRYPVDPTRDFIKRCIGLPGDEIEIRNKQVHVNGETLSESGYVYHVDSRTYPSSVFLSDDYRYRDNFGPFTVPDDEFFFMGDNRDDSHDSRFWGTVPASFVKGRAFLVYWSFDSSGESAGWPGYVGRVRQLIEVAWRFPVQTRWERSLDLIR